MAPKKDYGLWTRDYRPKSIKQFPLKRSLFISSFFHLFILGTVVFLLPSDEAIDKAAGIGDSGFIINVELVGAPDASHPLLNPLPSRERNKKGGGLVSQLNEGGEGGSSKVLQQIRNKIERAKFYPLIAKRSRVEGSPLIEFKIKNDGSLEYVTLKQSSGFKILDEVALNTVKEAAPYPFYPDPIALNIKYALSPTW